MEFIFGKVKFLLDPALHHACMCCGNCCKSIINLLPSDIEMIEEELLDYGDDYPFPFCNEDNTMKYCGDTCVFFVNNKCSIYSFRPLACRIFPYELVGCTSEHILVKLRTPVPFGCKGVFLSDRNKEGQLVFDVKNLIEMVPAIIDYWFEKHVIVAGKKFEWDDIKLDTIKKIIFEDGVHV